MHILNLFRRVQLRIKIIKVKQLKTSFTHEKTQQQWLLVQKRLYFY